MNNGCEILSMSGFNRILFAEELNCDEKIGKNNWGSGFEEWEFSF